MASPRKPKAAPKLRAISSHPEVAVTIDGGSWPYHVLLLAAQQRWRKARASFPSTHPPRSAISVLTRAGLGLLKWSRWALPCHG